MSKTTVAIIPAEADWFVIWRNIDTRVTYRSRVLAWRIRHDWADGDEEAWTSGGPIFVAEDKHLNEPNAGVDGAEWEHRIEYLPSGFVSEWES